MDSALTSPAQPVAATGNDGGTAAAAEGERQTAPRSIPPRSAPPPGPGDSCSSGGGAADGRQLQSGPPAAAQEGRLPGRPYRSIRACALENGSPGNPCYSTRL